MARVVWLKINNKKKINHLLLYLLNKQSIKIDMSNRYLFSFYKILKKKQENIEKKFKITYYSVLFCLTF